MDKRLRALRASTESRHQLIRAIEGVLPGGYRDAKCSRLVSLVYQLEANAQYAGEMRQQWRQAKRRPAAPPKTETGRP